MATREAVELAMARQFGFEDVESFRAGLAQSFPKTVVNRLQKELAKYPSASEAPASPPESRH